MAEIKLVLNNRTPLDLIFSYNGIDYEISAKRSLTVTVEAGHQVSVHDPNHTRLTKRKVPTESDIFIYNLDKNTAIDCELVGWELKLRLGVYY